MENNSFILYTNYFDILKDLSDSDLGIMFRAILSYKTTGNYELPSHLQLAFRFLKNQLDIDNEKWLKTKEARSQAGKKGGAPKGNNNANKTSKNKQKQAKTSKNKQNKHNDNDNVNDNVNVNVNENDNDKQIEQPKQPVAPASKKKSPQAVMCDYFKSRYKANTGLEYLTNNEDFVILADLIKKYGMEQVKQRIDWFETSCLNAVFWFAKSINDFTIGNLRKHWNKILKPITEEQRRQEQEKKKEEERMKRVLAEVQRRKEEESKWNTQ